ncbi:MAG: hypothetical protein SFU99_15290 [Saprospiraceae bacterium]|nr:hypothetical protein [Saprospiraceae bacterium]
MIKRHYLFIFLLAVTLNACIKPAIKELDFVEVATIRAVETGLGSVHLEGELKGLREGIIEDHGFILSDTGSNLSLESQDVVKLSLGQLASNGRFEKLLDGLSLQDIYYARAYAVFGERITYGEVLFFTFSDAIILSVSKNFVVINDSLNMSATIAGLQRFGVTLPEHGHVISAVNPFPEAEKDITSRLGLINDDGIFNSSFNNLSFNTTYYARAYIKLNEGYFYSDTIHIRIRDGWKMIGDAPLPLRNAIGVATATRAYVGIGCANGACNVDGGTIKSLWEFDPNGNNGQGSWIEKKPFPGADRYGATAFTIGEMVYVGLGGLPNNNGGINYYKDFWRFDPSTNNWEQTTDFPGKARWESVAFAINGKGYVGTGAGDEDYYYDFYEFDPEGNAGKGSWAMVDSLPAVIYGDDNIEVGLFGRKDAVSFVIGNKGYVGTGEWLTERLRDFWVFDAATKQWEQAGYLPDNSLSRKGAVAFTINGKGYLCTGQNDDLQYLSDLWEFNPNNNSWTNKTSFTGLERWQALGFSIGEKGYIGTGRTLLTEGLNFVDLLFSDFWIYTPEK